LAFGSIEINRSSFGGEPFGSCAGEIDLSSATDPSPFFYFPQLTFRLQIDNIFAEHLKNKEDDFMLANGQFHSSFMFTLYCIAGCIAGLAAFIGILLVAKPVGRALQSFREWLGRTWFACLIREIGAIVRAARVQVKNFFLYLLSIITILANAFRKIPWTICGTCVMVLTLCSLPFAVFFIAGMPLCSIFGVMAAGGAIGALCAPFSGWKCREFGFLKAVGISILTVIGGAICSSALIACLIAMAYD
jgi:hypothetical protein